ncbi:MAG TPA: NUDIX hydrolase [Candidatus Saccharimonadales bacterium]|nr:NUDIX hydrolase [Candidatus Saccharimonadales bacterium]
MSLLKLHHLLGRLSSPFQHAGFFVYNHFFSTQRSRVLVWNENNELLLVRNWGGKQHWGLPGGGVEKNESPVAAAKRELYEEVGVSLPLDDFHYVTTLHYKYEAPIYTLTIQSDMVPDKAHNPWEITALEWFSPSDLPANLSPLVPLALEELSNSA